MGADGGIKLQRKDLIQQKKSSKFDEATAQEYNKTGKWSTCHLTNKILDIPIVSDYMGNLYNKDSILEYLLDPESISESQKILIKHIKNLKDVVELKIEKDITTGGLICPITCNVLGSNGIKYVYLVKCRDVFAEKCLKEINQNELRCPVCNEDYDESNVIVINPTSKEDIAKLEERMDNLTSKNLAHSLKKTKKQKKRNTEEVVLSQKSKKVKV